MDKFGSRNSSGHSRRSGSDSGSLKETGSGSNRSNNSMRREEPEPIPDEQGIEVMAGKKRGYISTSHAGVVHRKDVSTAETELTLSPNVQEDLQVVPEAAQHLERPSIEMTQHQRMQQAMEEARREEARARREELRGIPYEEYVEHVERQNNEDHALDGSYRMDRNFETMSRPGSIRGGTSSMSVVSDVSYGDRPYQALSTASMSVVSLNQDSGSQWQHLNTSGRSTSSMTHGSRRMTEKRAHMIRTGSFVWNELDNQKKKEEDKDLAFERWGGRKNYNSGHDRKKRKMKKLGDKRTNSDKSYDTSKSKSRTKKDSRSLKSHVDPHSGLGMDTIRSTAEIKGTHGFHDLWGFAFKQDHMQYEQLIKEDKDRELVASYCEEPFWKIIFHFKGTVLRVIIEDILFWLTLATYVSIRIRFRMEPSEEDFSANYDNLSSNLVYVGGFLLFFLVFYVNQNHHRYFELHKDSMIMMGRVNDMAVLCKAILPMERARRIVRFMNAAHVAMYTGLSSTYEKENFFDPLEARFALLTDEELYRVIEEIDVDNSGPKAAYEIITWIMCDIRDAQLNSFIDTNEAMQLREQLLTFRSTIAKVFVTTTLPIPFFYVHFLSMLTAVYLPLFAVVNAFETGEVDDSGSTWVAEVVSGLVVFLQALFVIGLRILGQQLSDPYGGDLIDLQVSRYVNMILNGSNQILAAKRLHPPSVETELRLQLKMSSLGEAFEYDTDDEIVVQH